MMKVSKELIIGCALVFMASCPVTAAVKAKPKAKHAHAHAKVHAVTYTCSHCQRKFTVKSAADLNKPCPVCKCGLPAKVCVKH